MENNLTLKIENVQTRILSASLPMNVEPSNPWIAPIFRLLILFTVAFCGLANSDKALGQEPQRSARPRPDAFERPFLIEFYGPINGTRVRYLRSRIEVAKRQQADLVIVEFDSPGGGLEESYAIAELLRDLDWAYTVALCDRQALSGAALACMGCDELLVGPNARVGDIGVIRPDFAEFAFRFAPAKIISDVVAFGRAMAQAKGRSPDLVEAMIDQNIVVYTRNEGEGNNREFRTVRVGDANDLDETWVMIPESGPERFLELTGERNVELGLASRVVASRAELEQYLNYRPNQLITQRFRTTDSLAAFFGHPLMVGLLIVVGTLALYFELSSPGIGIGGIIACICAGLFFWSSIMGGTAGVLEVLLFIGGVGCLLLEIFVIPGWGISGIVGILMILSSAILAGQNFVWPRTPTEMNQFLTTLSTVFGSVLLVMVGAIFITRRVGRIPVLNQIVLAPPTTEAANATKDSGNGKASSGGHPVVSVGDWGEAVTVLRPAGRARFAGKFVDVVSDGDFIEPGTQVRVLQINGGLVTVTQALQEDA
jgi:membrane-bound serine protease (ClpP class)